jgi:hemerythrin-like domain-containing protein
MAVANNFKRQWADGPLPLIESPLYKLRVSLQVSYLKHQYQILIPSQLKGETMKEGSATAIATEMSNIHNLIIRSLNCILLQAPNLTEENDQKDMVTFAYALCLMIHEHHETEETLYFPLIEQAAGISDIMSRNVVQHEAFTPGLHLFETYVRQLRNGVATWDSARFMSLVESFAPTLTTHLADEINTLLDLEQYNLNWAPIMKSVQENVLANIDAQVKTFGVPLFIQNLDVTYEEGVHVEHGDWPPMPWVALTIFRWIYIPKQKSAWRFASCDPYGRPKELPFAPLKKTINGSA